MRKRILCCTMSIVILILSASAIFAVQPRWLYTNSVVFNMYFDGEEGSLEGSIDCYSTTTKIEGTITLYKKNFLGLWSKTGDTWNISTNSDYLIINKTFNAESGKTYKAELDVDVYSGSNSENITDDATGTCP